MPAIFFINYFLAIQPKHIKLQREANKQVLFVTDIFGRNVKLKRIKLCSLHYQDGSIEKIHHREMRRRSKPFRQNKKDSSQIRLNKYIANSGICSDVRLTNLLRQALLV